MQNSMDNTRISDTAANGSISHAPQGSDLALCAEACGSYPTLDLTNRNLVFSYTPMAGRGPSRRPRDDRYLWNAAGVCLQPRIALAPLAAPPL
jgi:hypothetical protein